MSDFFGDLLQSWERRDMVWYDAILTRVQIPVPEFQIDAGCVYEGYGVHT